MPATELPLLDFLSALADQTRCRMLWLLEQQELTVSELCAVLQLPQSTVSRHLKTLADAQWVTSRRDGTSRYYALATHGDSTHTQIWQLTREQLAGRVGVAQDGRRLARVLADRSRTSQQFFATAAGEWDRLREELFGGGSVPPGVARVAARRLDRGRSRVRHRHGTGGTGAAPRAGDWHRCLRRDVGGGPGACRRRWQRGVAPGHTRGAAAPGRVGGCGADDARPPSSAGARAGAHRGLSRAQAGRAAVDRGHGAARSRGVPAGNGTRLARILRRPVGPAAGIGRVCRRGA